MTRDQALRYVSYCVDDTQSIRQMTDMPADAVLVGWQCGFEPLFVAVWSYLSVQVDACDAEALATDLLREKRWFADNENPPEPDYCIV